VALNNVARSITRTRRRDHVTIKDLLDLAGLESANRMVIKAIAAETWGCFHSNDGKDGARNHVGRILFSDKRTDTAKTTRSAKTGQIAVPLRGVTPSSHTRTTCGTGQSCYAPRRRRRQQRRRHQTWQVFPRFSRDPAGLDLPPAARGVFPAVRGAPPAGRGASPREPRSWALVKTSPSRALLTSFFTSSGRGRRNEDGNLLLKWAEENCECKCQIVRQLFLF
jgi:hypothetical protein